MNRTVTDLRFDYLRQKNEKALIMYFPLGEPGFDSVKMAETYINNGVDILEIGYPVKDPYVDGKVISSSMERILSSRFSMESYFKEIARIKKAFPDIPLEVFSYKQIFDDVSYEYFAELCADNGVDCVLIADEDNDVREKLSKVLPETVDHLQFMPFSYNKEDLDTCKKYGGGYIFLQATDGATGARDELEPELNNKASQLKEIIRDIPICAGFGISKLEHCMKVKDMDIDGVIIGSAIVDYLINHSLEETGSWIKLFKDNLK